MDITRNPALLARLIAEAADQILERPDLAPVTANALRNLARDISPRTR
jgi:hypothetical protein